MNEWKNKIDFFDVLSILHFSCAKNFIHTKMPEIAPKKKHQNITQLLNIVDDIGNYHLPCMRASFLPRYIQTLNVELPVNLKIVRLKK